MRVHMSCTICRLGRRPGTLRLQTPRSSQERWHRRPDAGGWPSGLPCEPPTERRKASIRCSQQQRTTFPLKIPSTQCSGPTAYLLGPTAQMLKGPGDVLSASRTYIYYHHSHKTAPAQDRAPAPAASATFCSASPASSQGFSLPVGFHDASLLMHPRARACRRAEWGGGGVWMRHAHEALPRRST
jgi:hypothetical protein